MTAYLYGFPNGVVGCVSRPDGYRAAPIMLANINGGGYPSAYGAPLKTVVVNGLTCATQFVAGDAATSLAGFLVREVPSISGYAPYNANGTDPSQDFTGGVPNPEQVQGLLFQGFISVKCAVGTPVRNGTVYIRVTAATGKNIGDLEATADGSSNVALLPSQAVWAVDGKDANGVGEIRVGYTV